MSLDSIIERINELRDGLVMEIAVRQARLDALNETLAILQAKEPENKLVEKLENADPVLKEAPSMPRRSEGAYGLWTDNECDRLRDMWEQKVPTREIASKLGRSMSAIQARAWILGLPKRGRLTGRKQNKAAGASEPKKPFRRFTDHGSFDPESVNGLPEDHQSVVSGRTLFPSTVVEPIEQTRVLVSGGNSRKLGDRIVKGPWSGLPIFSLTLEERATCPRSCHHWTTCYGNGMPRARRHRHGSDLVAALDRDIRKLLTEHPQGIAIRLHQLGDFYDNSYVTAWWTWLHTHETLRVFGYTAHAPDSKVGKGVAELNRQFPDRCAIRFSSTDPQPMGATTIWQKSRGRIAEGIVCPAQTGDTDCCGTCGLCWHPNFRDKTIVFMAHGKKTGPRNPKPVQQVEADRTKAIREWPTEKSSHTKKDGAVGETNGRFSTPVKRRCAACQGIFETKNLDDLICLDCREIFGESVPEIEQAVSRDWL